MRWITPLALAAAAGLSVGCPSEYRHEERDRVVVYDRPTYQPAPEYRERVVVEQEPVQVTEVVAGPEVEVSEFREQLSPYGQWIVVEGLGECWAPSGVDPAWRPYTVGYYVHSRYGPTWVSQERFGWATYHYGRWAEIRGHRWVWVPGRTWGPAWVAWRSGDGYCGWAPLPPRGGERLVITAYDADDIPPEHFVFCQERYVYEPRVREHWEPERNNVTIINRTTNITNITVVNNRVVSHGVDVHEVERASGHKVSDVRVQEASSFTELRTRHDEQWQRYHPQAAQHEVLHEQHVAEHDAAHQAHVDEHNANVAAHDAAHQAHVEQHDVAHQAHVDEHNADVAAHDAAHQVHVEQHDVAHEKHVTDAQTAQERRIAEQNAIRDKHLADQRAAEEKHLAEQKAAQDKVKAEHDAHVEAHDAAHEKHVSEQDAAKARQAADREARIAAENAAKARQDAARDQRIADQKAAKDKAAAEKNAKDKGGVADKNPKDKTPADKDPRQQ